MGERRSKEQGEREGGRSVAASNSRSADGNIQIYNRSLSDGLGQRERERNKDNR